MKALYVGVGFLLSLTISALLWSADAPSQTIDHSLFGQVLTTYVRDSQVDYAGLHKNPEQLDQYLSQMEALPQADFDALDKQQQLALLINLYNAATIRLVVKNYPVKSIKDIGGWMSGPFKQKFIKFLGKELSLDNIEHNTIRENYAEPRIHFALVCAAHSCPPLRGEPYNGAQLDAQLTDQARTFLGDESKNRLNHAKRIAHLSSIFKWYGKDFEKDGRTLAEAIHSYWPEKDQQLMTGSPYEVEYLTYDWTLNEWKK